ncbi:MAG: ferritin family protein [Desulfotomaculaceae bacterium]|nr:ferritin family protein [Desulfotomaculaceae bacterium]MDD4766862.1 ferritin family protein [Desulfotomaculaceae bacterium]
MWFFKPSEIAKIGMKIEENGLAFYRALAAKTEEPEAKTLFNFMAGEEEQHYKTFEALADKLQGYDISTFEDDYEDYMRDLANNSVFATDADPVAIAKGVNTVAEAIELALGFEKDSVLFYLQFKKMVPEEEKFGVHAIIDEEQKHIHQLLTIKKMYTTSREEFYIPKGDYGDAEI